jgi:hypothetical protein
MPPTVTQRAQLTPDATEAIMAALGRIPIYMRIGDGEEIHVGDIIPEAGSVTAGPDGLAQVAVTMPPIHEVLRVAADAFEAGERDDKPPA